MPKFTVIEYETVAKRFEVQASSSEEAVEKVLAGEVDYYAKEVLDGDLDMQVIDEAGNIETIDARKQYELLDG